MPKVMNKIDFHALPKDYKGLVAMLPPRPIHDSVDYHNVMEVVLAMAGHKLTPDQDDYHEALSLFILEHDRERRTRRRRGTVQERLKYLLEVSNMTASDLGRMLGSRGQGSNLLTGKRELSKADIRILCAHFHLSADYFL